MMKMIIAIVQDEDATNLLNGLTENRFYATRLATSGGFLRAGNTTIITGVEDNQVESVMAVIEANCKTRKQMTTVHAPIAGSMDMYVPSIPVEVKVGGATVFVLDVEQFRKF